MEQGDLLSSLLAEEDDDEDAFDDPLPEPLAQPPPAAANQPPSHRAEGLPPLPQPAPQYSRPPGTTAGPQQQLTSQLPFHAQHLQQQQHIPPQQPPYQNGPGPSNLQQQQQPPQPAHAQASQHHQHVPSQPVASQSATDAPAQPSLPSVSRAAQDLPTPNSTEGSIRMFEAAFKHAGLTFPAPPTHLIGTDAGRQIMHRSLMELPHDKRQKVVQMLSHIKQQQIQAKLRQQQQDGTSANGLPPSGRGVSPAPQANGHDSQTAKQHAARVMNNVQGWISQLRTHLSPEQMAQCERAVEQLRQRPTQEGIHAFQQQLVTICGNDLINAVRRERAQKGPPTPEAGSAALPVAAPHSRSPSPLPYNAVLQGARPQGGMTPPGNSTSGRDPRANPSQQHAMPAANGLARQPPLAQVMASASQQGPRPGIQGTVNQQHLSAGAKRPLEGPPGGQPPPKRAATPPVGAAAREGRQDLDDDLDLFKQAGVDLAAEDEAASHRRAASSRAAAHAPPEHLCLDKDMLFHMIQGICRRHGVLEMSEELHVFLSRAVALHMGDLLADAAAVARQRKDANRRLPGMAPDPAANLMQQVAVIRRRDAEAAAATDEAKKVAAAAAEAATGSKAGKAEAGKAATPAVQPTAKPAGLTKDNWKAMAKGRAGMSAAAKASAPGPSTATKASAAQTATKSPEPQVPVRSLLPKSALDDSSKQLSLRDLTAAMQKHHNYCKSTMLYKLMLKEEHKPPSKT